MRTSQDYVPCPRCRTGKVLAGWRRKYNTKDKGQDICPECTLADIYARMKK